MRWGRQVSRARPGSQVHVVALILGTLLALGCVPARATRFVASPTLRVPHLGWSRVEPQPECRYLPEGYAYFAHSYKLDAIPPGWRGAYAEHGGRFVAALERGRVLACQFHPELSGQYGQEILRRWLEGV